MTAANARNKGVSTRNANDDDPPPFRGHRHCRRLHTLGREGADRTAGDQDRRAERHVGAVPGRDRHGVGDLRAGGGAAVRRPGLRCAGAGRRPSEQARRRRRHRAPVVRPRRSRRGDGRADVFGGAGGELDREGAQQALHQHRRRHRRPHRQPVHAGDDPLGVRHLHAGPLHRDAVDQARRRQVVLRHRGLRVRPAAGARRHPLCQGGRRPGAGRAALPRSRPPRISRRSCWRRRPPAPT